MVKACHLHNRGNELSFPSGRLQKIAFSSVLYRFNSIILKGILIGRGVGILAFKLLNPVLAHRYYGASSENGKLPGRATVGSVAAPQSSSDTSASARIPARGRCFGC